jgi:DNA-directed RNA polymerase II subunit RPB3
MMQINTASGYGGQGQSFGYQQ